MVMVRVTPAVAVAVRVTRVVAVAVMVVVAVIVPMTEIKYVSKAYIDAFLTRTRCSIRDHALFTVAFWRGLRASEIGLLCASDFKADSGRLYVRRSKGGLNGEYVLSPGERRALAAWLKVRGPKPGPLFASRRGGRPISRQQVWRLMRHYAARAGWPEDRIHPHTLRHSIAVHLVEQGVDLLVMKDWLGHRNIQSTMVYAQLTNKVRDEAAQKVYEKQERPDKEPRPAVNWSKDRRRS